MSHQQKCSWLKSYEHWYTAKNTPNHIRFLCCFAICVPWKGVKLNGIPRTPVARLRATNLCTFSMAATSASAARLKNADTAGISGVLLRVSPASLPCAHSSLQPVPGTLGRLLCSCSFGLSSVMKGKPITRGSFCSLQRKDRENSVPDNLKWANTLSCSLLSSTEY